MTFFPQKTPSGGGFNQFAQTAAPLLLGIGAQARGDTAGIARGMALMQAKQESDQRKAAIDNLMSGMGISGAQKDFLSSLPVELQQQYMLQQMAPKEPVRGISIGDNLVDPFTGEVMGNYGPEPLSGGDLASLGFGGYGEAIASIESGGNYGAKGPVVQKGSYAGDRAYGKYQVMGKNIPSWTKEALGVSMTPEEFLANPQAQDAVFRVKFGQSVAKYGNPQDAASVWFSGRPVAEAGNASDGMTTVPEYVQKFNSALGAQQPTPLDAGIERITAILATGKGTPAQREALKFKRDELIARRDQSDPIAALRARAQEAGLQPGTPEYQQFMANGGSMRGLAVRVGADGEMEILQDGALGQNSGVPTDQGKLGFEISKADGGLLNAAQEQAAAADSLSMNISEAENILMSGFDTGLGSGVKAMASKVGAATGLSGGDYAVDYENLDRVSKAIGIDTLRAMGGNDTERELLTAIQTTVSTKKEEDANLRVVANQRAAADVIAEKPSLMSQWLEQHGSLSARNEDGMTWPEYWRLYQVPRYQQLSGDYAREYQERKSGKTAQKKAGPPKEAVEVLKSDPSDYRRKLFDDVFGAGAAAKALGE